MGARTRYLKTVFTELGLCSGDSSWPYGRIKAIRSANPSGALHALL
jgi:hypothetical protein